MTALPHRHGLRPGKPARAPLSSKSEGKSRHPGARASRPHALPFGAAQFPCDAPPGHPAGGNGMGSAEAESWPRCRSTRVEEMAEAAGRLVRAGRPRSRVAFIRSSIGTWVCSWFLFNSHRQFLPPMICPAGQGRNLSEPEQRGCVQRQRQSNIRASDAGRQARPEGRPCHP